MRRPVGKLIAALRGVVSPADLVGVYLHGSLAMGCFNPLVSDIDVLVVVGRKLDVATKAAIGDALLRLSREAPPNGIELSVLTRAALENWVHPAPFELHFSKEWADDYAAARVDFERERTDPDLAAHVTVTRRRGVTLFGRPIAEVFLEIPWRDYLASILADAEQSFGNVERGPDRGECHVPMYAVLNACRVLAAVEERLVLSKREGGEWAKVHLPTPCHPIIDSALREYASGSPEHVDAAALKAWSREVYRRINGKSADDV